ncbi:hypothetical protein [Albimonas pacifica]|uniref:Uncharacterized protein n=1 Tax=Albimonas pacifica TaxID=1114924 RepID=A0A1I3I4A0_9RHOB|nr:hypothetical protein [Albimonas pacifica]SFI42761.1 hypothetical protein SAMN05216258_106331 [Albimonas pacifica]
MAEARAARCRVRGPQGSAGRLTALAADALRTAPDPGGRLLLLRRLDLGLAAPRGAGGDPARAALARRADEALRRAALTAVHGGAPHAGAAGAVWFRDLAEARRLLLLRRARGAPTDAWFWRLAVPGAARGADPAPAAAAALLGEAARSAEAEQELARLLREAAGQGAAPALVALLLAARGGAAETPAAVGAAGPQAPSAAPTASVEAQAEARRLLDAAPEAVAGPLRRLLRRPPGTSAPPAWLRRAALLAAAPGLAAAPRRLETLAGALTLPAAPRGPERGPRAAPAVGGAGARADPAPPAPPGAPAAAPDRGRPARRTDGEATESDATPSPAPEPAPPPDAEVFSPSAGLLLAATPLRKAGFADWLAGRGDLAAAGFGPAFLWHLARVQARDAADPLLDCLAPWAGAPAADPGWARAWRRGLDSWLRRRAGRRLHDLAGRGGWLTWTEGRIEARYPAAAADLALRRRGLDADPGWVPWLGRSLRYRFDDAPAP